MVDDRVPIAANQSYEETNRTDFILPNPVQSDFISPSPNYDTVVLSNKGAISNYDDVVDLKPKLPEHPPPVGGVSTPNEDQFYNADTHMYAAVDKGARSRKEEGGAN